MRGPPAPPNSRTTTTSPLASVAPFLRVNPLPPQHSLVRISALMKTPVLCWLLAAALVGLTGLLRNTALPVAGLCALLTLAALGVLAVMPGMRRKAMAVSIEHLVSLSLMRLWGLYLIWLDRRGLIASDMAVIAGWGPLIVALGAIVVLFVLKRDRAAGRAAVLVWNI